jgi:hypothetical protein
MMLALLVSTTILVTDPALATQPEIPAKEWAATPEVGRLMWVRGFIEGYDWKWLGLSDSCKKSSDKKDDFRGRAIGVTIGQLSEVMDDLYKDPANANISWEALCSAASHKIVGHDIEPLLQLLRAARHQATQRKN